MPEVILLGDLRVDFVAETEADESAFHRRPGGTTAEVAGILNGWGVKTGFLGKVGDDPQGHFFAHTLGREGIDVSRLRFDSRAWTSVCIRSEEEGGFSQTYQDKPAPPQIGPEEIDAGYFQEARLLHFRSGSLAQEPARSATLRATRLAGEKGVTVFLHTDVELSLWGKEDPTGRLLRMLANAWPLADVVFMTGAEAELVTGERTVRKAAELLHARGPRLVAVTLGERGSYFSYAGRRRYMEGTVAMPKIKGGSSAERPKVFAASMAAGLAARIHGHRGLTDASLRKIFTAANEVVAGKIERPSFLKTGGGAKSATGAKQKKGKE